MVSACWGWIGWVFVPCPCASLAVKALLGVWHIRCMAVSGIRADVRLRMCRVRTSRERTRHMPLGSYAIRLKVQTRTYECVACTRM